LLPDWRQTGGLPGMALTTKSHVKLTPCNSQARITPVLSKKQWQWAADHNQQIRSVSLVALAIGAMVYGGFIWKTLWDKGKTNMPVPFVPDASFSKAYKCKD
jgi:hypothetical protein